MMVIPNEFPSRKTSRPGISTPGKGLIRSGQMAIPGEIECDTAQPHEPAAYEELRPIVDNEAETTEEECQLGG